MNDLGPRTDPWGTPVNNLVCSGSIVVNTLESGPGDSWFESRVGGGCQYSMRLDRLHRAYPSLHPFGVVQWYQSCRTSRQRLGVNRIDSCNFELCSQGQLCILSIQRYSRMGWAAMSNKMPGCHLVNAWRSRSKHILQWRYYTAMKYQFIHSFRVVHGSDGPAGRVGSGRVGSRFWRILAGRVGSGQHFRF